jgi:hypothetical protein
MAMPCSKFEASLGSPARARLVSGRTKTWINQSQDLGSAAQIMGIDNAPPLHPDPPAHADPVFSAVAIENEDGGRGRARNKNIENNPMQSRNGPRFVPP